MSDTLDAAQTIRSEPARQGRILTCPAGHTYGHGATPDPQLLAVWIAAHETHEETT